MKLEFDSTACDILMFAYCLLRVPLNTTHPSDLESLNRQNHVNFPSRASYCSLLQHYRYCLTLLPSYRMGNKFLEI